MPTLLQINSCNNTGSTGRIAEQIGAIAISKGWQSYIAYGRSSRESASELIKIGSSLDIGLHGLKTRIFDKHGLGSTDATKKLICQIENIKPDIIHLHNIHGYYINYEILFGYLAAANIPVVWTLHDCWPITGHCAYFSFVGCEKWKTQCEKCPQKENYPSSLLFDNSADNYRKKKKAFTSIQNLTIIPVSNWLCRIIEHSFLDKYPIKVIWNGTDTTVFSPRDTSTIKLKYSIPDKYILLGVATSWGDRKGLQDYYKLSEILPTAFQIVLVGLTSRQLKKLPKKIIGIQRTESADELAQLYSIADIILNLSQEETFGLTTVEGFACGTPGIVLNCTASPELITQETGLIVEQNNIEQLTDAIKNMTTIGKSHYSKECRERAENLYNKDDKFTEYITLYDKLLTTQQ